MTRRDELARKLSEGGVPEPPEELLHRIKKDIPSQLPISKLEGEIPPMKLYRTGWALAASLLALVAMSYMMLRVLQSSGIPKSSVAAASSSQEETVTERSDVPAVARPSQSVGAEAASPAPLMGGRADAVSEQKVQRSPEEIASEKGKTLTGSTSGFATEIGSLDSGRKEEEQQRAASNEVSAQVSDQAREQPVVAQSAKVADNSGTATSSLRDEERNRAAAAPAPPPPPAAAGSAGAVLEARRMAQKPAAAAATVPQPTPADALSKTRKDVAADEALPSNVSSFSFDGTTGSYELIRTSLLKDELPSPQVVRVGEVINHFDYGDEIPRRSELAIHAEGTHDPLSGSEDTAVIRIAIRGRSQLPAGANVRVEFDPRAVIRFRLVGYNQSGRDSAPEIGTGQSITALYEVRLRKDAGRAADVATVRVRYASPGDSRQTNDAEKSITMADISRSWSAASPRLKLAVLVADWAEMLRRSTFGESIDPRDLAAKAQQLSTDFDGEGAVDEFIALAKRTAMLLGARD